MKILKGKTMIAIVAVIAVLFIASSCSLNTQASTPATAGMNKLNWNVETIESNRIIFEEVNVDTFYDTTNSILYMDFREFNLWNTLNHYDPITLQPLYYDLEMWNYLGIDISLDGYSDDRDFGELKYYGLIDVYSDGYLIGLDLTSYFQWLDDNQVLGGPVEGHYDNTYISVYLSRDSDISLSLWQTYSYANDLANRTYFYSGQIPAYFQGYNTGLEEGLQQGFLDGVDSVDTQYYVNQGYQQARDNYYDSRYQAGLQAGYQAPEAEHTILTFVASILAVVLSALIYLGTEISLFGINALMVVVLIGSFTIVLVIFKMIRGG